MESVTSIREDVPMPDVLFNDTVYSFLPSEELNEERTVKPDVDLDLKDQDVQKDPNLNNIETNGKSSQVGVCSSSEELNSLSVEKPSEEAASPSVLDLENFNDDDDEPINTQLEEQLLADSEEQKCLLGEKLKANNNRTCFNIDTNDKKLLNNEIIAPEQVQNEQVNNFNCHNVVNNVQICKNSNEGTSVHEDEDVTWTEESKQNHHINRNVEQIVTINNSDKENDCQMEVMDTKPDEMEISRLVPDIFDKLFQENCNQLLSNGWSNRLINHSNFSMKVKVSSCQTFQSMDIEENVCSNIVNEIMDEILEKAVFQKSSKITNVTENAGKLVNELLTEIIDEIVSKDTKMILSNQTENARQSVEANTSQHLRENAGNLVEQLVTEIIDEIVSKKVTTFSNPTENPGFLVEDLMSEVIDEIVSKEVATFSNPIENARQLVEDLMSEVIDEIVSKRSSNCQNSTANSGYFVKELVTEIIDEIVSKKATVWSNPTENPSPEETLPDTNDKVTLNAIQLVEDLLSEIIDDIISVEVNKKNKTEHLVEKLLSEDIASKEENTAEEQVENLVPKVSETKTESEKIVEELIDSSVCQWEEKKTAAEDCSENSENPSEGKLIVQDILEEILSGLRNETKNDIVDERNEPKLATEDSPIKMLENSEITSEEKHLLANISSESILMPSLTDGVVEHFQLNANLQETLDSPKVIVRQIFEDILDQSTSNEATNNTRKRKNDESGDFTSGNLYENDTEDDEDDETNFEDTFEHEDIEENDSTQNDPFIDSIINEIVKNVVRNTNVNVIVSELIDEMIAKAVEPAESLLIASGILDEIISKIIPDVPLLPLIIGTTTIAPEVFKRIRRSPRAAVSTIPIEPSPKRPRRTNSSPKPQVRTSPRKPQPTSVVYEPQVRIKEEPVFLDDLEELDLKPVLPSPEELMAQSRLEVKKRKYKKREEQTPIIIRKRGPKPVVRETAPPEKKSRKLVKPKSKAKKEAEVQKPSKTAEKRKAVEVKEPPQPPKSPKLAPHIRKKPGPKPGSSRKKNETSSTSFSLPNSDVRATRLSKSSSLPANPPPAPVNKRSLRRQSPASSSSVESLDQGTIEPPVRRRFVPILPKPVRGTRSSPQVATGPIAPRKTVGPRNVAIKSTGTRPVVQPRRQVAVKRGKVYIKPKQDDVFSEINWSSRNRFHPYSRPHYDEQEPGPSSRIFPRKYRQTENGLDRIKPCNVRLEKMPIIDRLLVQKKQIEEPNICELCEPKRIFVSKQGLVEHLKQEHAEFFAVLPSGATSDRCPGCDKKYHSFNRLTTHMNSCPSVEYNRPTRRGNKAALSQKPVEEVMKYSCPECKAPFSLFSAYCAHLKNHDGKKLCLFCGLCINNRFELVQHLLTHGYSNHEVKNAIKNILGEEIELKIDNSVIDSESIEENDRDIVDSSIFQCEKCNRFFTIRILFERHQRLIADAEKLKNPKCCPKCDFKNDSICLMGSHIEWHKKNRNDNFICRHCNLNFRSENNLVRHELEHEGKINSICKFCDENFDNIDKLNCHFVNCKMKNGPFQCKMCDRSFESRWLLQNHYNLHKNQIFFCDKCARSFRHLKNLNRHVLSKCGAEPSYKCEECLKFFLNLKLLASHIRETHGSEKLFICQFCSCEFLTRNQLTRHEARHNKDRLKLTTVNNLRVSQHNT